MATETDTPFGGTARIVTTPPPRSSSTFEFGWGGFQFFTVRGGELVAISEADATAARICRNARKAAR